MLATKNYSAAFWRRVASLGACVLLIGSLAVADKKSDKLDPIAGRVVDLEIRAEDTIVIVAAGKDQGIDKTWRARFREGTATKLLPGGEAILIRIDYRTTVLKTRLTPEQVRANRIVQFDRP